MICSHPLLFGVEKLKVFDSLEPEATMSYDFNLRACLFGSNNVKFLFRYEIDTSEEDEAVATAARFRVSRVAIDLESHFSFLVVPQPQLSQKNLKEHIFIVQVVDKMPVSEMYETPVIKALQILNYEGLWTMEKKDARGNLFVIRPNENAEEKP